MLPGTFGSRGLVPGSCERAHQENFGQNVVIAPVLHSHGLYFKNRYEPLIAIAARSKESFCVITSVVHALCATQTDALLLSAYTPKFGIYAK